MKTVAYPHPVAPGQAGFREPENSTKLSRQGGPIPADPPASPDRERWRAGDYFLKLSNAFTFKFWFSDKIK